MSLSTHWQAASRRQRIVSILVLVWMLYALLGYFVLSPWLRSTVVTEVSELTGREVVLQKAVFNPLALSLSLQGFALRDLDGTDLFAFDELYANFQLSSLFRWSIHFDRISLYEPRGRVVQSGPQSFNFDDIVARLSAEDESQVVQEQTAPTALPRFSFRELLVVQGDFRFRDEARPQPDELVLAPVSFQVLDFSTRADGQGNNKFQFSLTGPAGGQFDWAGSVAFDPLLASGRLALSGVDLSPFADFFQHQFAFTVPSAMLDIASDYRFEADPDGRLKLQQGVISLSNVEIRDPQLEDPVLRLPLLELSGIEIDTVDQQVGIERLLLQGLDLEVRLRDKGLHLEKLFMPLPNDPQEDEQAPSSNGQVMPQTDQVASIPAQEPAPWHVLLGRLELTDASITVIDETLAEPATLALSPINLTLEQVALNRDEVFSLNGDMVLAESGRINLTGEGRFEPLQVTLQAEVTALPLGAVQGWLQDSAAAKLSAGELAARLIIEHGSTEGATDQADTRVNGQVTISNLNLAELNGSPLVSFSSLELDGIALSLLNSQLNIDTVTLADLRAQSLIDESGQDVSVRIAVPAAAATASSAQPATESSPWSFAIGELRLRNGELVHMDRSLSPVFRVGLYRLEGDIRGLSSDPGRQADINLNARLDQISPLNVRGKIAPLAQLPQMDLVITMSGYEMNSLTPFTGQYLGYAVESGQLAVSSELVIEGSVLNSQSRIRAANFFLGDSVPSDEALNAPIKLGLAVLRDRSGLIDLPVNASGDLNDPSVSVSGIILRAVTNVMIKAATSPFSALASLAGGQELTYIDFADGDSQPTESGVEQMATLAKMLGERPSLLMNLSGSARQGDRLPLATQALGQQLMEEQWAGLDAALDDRDFRRAVQSLYREQTDERAELLLGDTVIEDREQRDREVAARAFSALAQREADAVSDSRLEELAAARAQQSKVLLVDQFGLDGERLFIVAATVNSEASVSGVLLDLGAR
ncbi:DUF748 domain-containing protein [Alcanivorax sp. 1008]|uniref:DUF748 domain-containing protein n=1 Tax=Alcanivorax sp. 1008 TaxID=2816853 RepID=UPI001D2D86F5|nr:DUF748 domain-containing protein [Alcanivorax sp. 1008]MCC1495527.1 DUF748 domain-containing protein [Alcanivorax sp. 1008]